MRWIRRNAGGRWLLYGAGVAGLVREAEVEAVEAGARSEPIDPSIQFEPEDVYPKWVLLAGGGVLVGIWVIVLVLYPLFAYFKYDRTGGRTPEKVLVYLPPKPPPPRNEATPHRDLRQFLARQRTALESYGWVDRGRGIVSIPIEQAMRIVARQGIPPAPLAARQPYPPSAGTKATGFEGKVEPLPR